jgi:hypothetical protein
MPRRVEFTRRSWLVSTIFDGIRDFADAGEWPTTKNPTPILDSARSADAGRHVDLQRAPEFPRLRRVGDRCGCRIPRRHANKRRRSRSCQQLATRPPHAAARRTTRRLGRLDPLGPRSGQGQTRQQQPPRLMQTPLALPAAQQAVVPILCEPIGNTCWDAPTSCRKRTAAPTRSG